MKMRVINLEFCPGQVAELVRASSRGCRFYPWSGHRQEATHERIHKWNNKSNVPLSPPSSLSLCKNFLFHSVEIQEQGLLSSHQRGHYYAVAALAQCHCHRCPSSPFTPLLVHQDHSPLCLPPAASTAWFRADAL